MIQNTYNAMHDELKAAIHAPTGTGKSLAYLIAYVAIKLENPDFKMSISTYTHRLQEQLIRDIDMANQIYLKCVNELKLERNALEFTILKGKSNYFCAFNFEKNENDLSSVDVKLINKMLSTIESENLKLERSNFKVPLSDEVLSKITVDECYKRCSFSKSCTYYQDFVESKSDIYILNHALYFNRQFYTDGWNYSFSVFDEAHKLDKVIMEASTFQFSIDTLEEFVRRGAQLLYKYNVPKKSVNKWIQTYLHKHPFVLKFKQGTNVIFSNLEKGEFIYTSIGYPLDGFKNILTELNAWTKEVLKSVSVSFLEEEGTVEVKEDGYSFHMGQWEFALNDLAWFNHILSKDGVLWLEKTDDKLYYKATPQNILQLDNVFSNNLLLTSGTLSVNNSCETIADRLNLKLDINKVLPSPFDLKSNSIVYYNPNMHPYSNTYFKDVTNEILELFDIGEGKTFVLFTALELMKSQYNSLKTKLILKYGQNIDIFLQGQDSHELIMASFNNPNKKTILFGSLTYFEGIDLKGKALTQVIMVKLPFSRPNQPIQQILDSAFNYSEWEAIIRFEQAFGRINRTKTDYGSFCVLDNRVEKSKFKVFLEVFRSQDIPIITDKNELKEFYKLKS